MAKGNMGIATATAMVTGLITDLRIKAITIMVAIMGTTDTVIMDITGITGIMVRGGRAADCKIRH